MKIRNVKLSDIKALAVIHYECWMKTYSGILPEKYLQSLTLASFEKRWTSGMAVNDDVIRLVSLENSQPIGFIVGLENRFPEKCPEADGEIWALYVDPDHWAKGHGKKLFEEFKKRLKRKNILVWVLAANTRGRKFYEAMGGKLQPATHDFVVNEEKFPEVAYLFTGEV
ncbi:MAG: GNAT family N-acetyltransferase [Bacteriovoracaceae bacterium]